LLAAHTYQITFDRDSRLLSDEAREAALSATADIHHTIAETSQTRREQTPLVIYQQAKRSSGSNRVSSQTIDVQSMAWEGFAVSSHVVLNPSMESCVIIDYKYASYARFERLAAFNVCLGVSPKAKK
jgi:hypothetical protein